MSKINVLTSTQKASLTIDHFIFHILIAGEEEPKYLAEVKLTDGQHDFFQDTLIRAAEGTQYIFSDEEASTPRRCKKIIDDPSTNFLEQSRLLALEFLGHHKRNMSNGVFVVAAISIDSDTGKTPLVSVLKIDHARVLQYVTERTRGGLIARMSEILNTFVEDSSAIQKSALVDVSDAFSWDILARQRHTQEGIADYFEGFLCAKLHEDASFWTRKAVTSVHKWAIDNIKHIPEGIDSSLFKHKAITYLENHSTFDTDSFLDLVIPDEISPSASSLRGSLHDRLAEEGLAGQVFTPKPQSIPKRVKKNKKITKEGVSIEWEGEAAAAGVKFTQLEGGKTRITVETSKIVSQT